MDGDNMSKWKFWKKVTEAETVQSKVKYCCNCGGKIMRQTTLDEFFDLTPESQKRLTDYEMTESVGFGNTPRRYRGML
tara:strand:+ start:359 stop:592 length:234 start_codon:yes stop_codon:yes gene_type:complete